MKFTSGQWTYERSNPHTDEVVTVSAGSGLHAKWVCTMWQDVDREEFEANARLIAAAPDLYEACEDALAFVKELSRHGIARDWSGESGLRAALKKARGEA